MTEKVYYDDNLIYLFSSLKNIEHGLKMNITPELFMSKIIAELLFIDKTIQHFYSDLSNNRNLINREQHLHSLMRLKLRFKLILESILTTDDEHILSFKEEFPKLERALQIHQTDISDIRALITKIEPTKNEKDMISANEMNFLLAPDEEEPV